MAKFHKQPLWEMYHNDTIVQGSLEEHIDKHIEAAQTVSRIITTANSKYPFAWRSREQTLPWLGSIGAKMTHVPTGFALHQVAEKLPNCTLEMEHQVNCLFQFKNFLRAFEACDHVITVVTHSVPPLHGSKKKSRFV
jgi:hypothetical protein